MQAVAHQPAGLGTCELGWLVIAAGGLRRKPGQEPGKQGRHAQVLDLIDMISESGSRAGGHCTLWPLVPARLCAGDLRVSRGRRLDQSAFRRDAAKAGSASRARGPRG